MHFFTSWKTCSRHLSASAGHLRKSIAGLLRNVLATILPALFCNASKDWLFPSPQHPHRVSQYLRIGLINEIYTTLALWVVRLSRRRPNIPTRSPALEIIFFTWLPQLRRSSKTTPRFVNSWTLSICLPSMCILKESVLASLAVVPKSIASVFLTLIKRLLLKSQRSLSFISIVEAWEDEQNKTVSSAYIRILHSDTASGRSFTRNMNNNGPRIDPWGTPIDTPSGFDNK